jgi:hypothetical protein
LGKTQRGAKIVDGIGSAKNCCATNATPTKQCRWSWWDWRPSTAGESVNKINKFCYIFIFRENQFDLNFPSIDEASGDDNNHKGNETVKKGQMGRQDVRFEQQKGLLARINLV